jgi:large subunit ribosomal protein L9
MRLLLLQDVRKLGHLGDVVEVSAGYGRNFLLPQCLATEPTPENVKAIEDRRRAATAERAMRLKQYADLVGQLKDVSVTIEAAANPEGTLYGSVAGKDIAVALQTQGYPIRPEHVILDAPIRTLDTRMVRLEFTDEIAAEVKVWVVREGGTPDVSSADTAESDRDDDLDDIEDKGKD